MGKKVILDSVLNDQLSLKEGKFVSFTGKEYDVFVAYYENHQKDLYSPIYYQGYGKNFRKKINTAQEKYSNLMLNFSNIDENLEYKHENENFFKIFTDFKYFLSKGTTSNKNNKNIRKSKFNKQFKIFIGKDEIHNCLFEFKLVWILESNYFSLLIKAINLLNKYYWNLNNGNESVNSEIAEEIHKFFGKYTRFTGLNWGYSFIGKNKYLDNSLLDLKELSENYPNLFKSNFKNIFINDEYSFKYIPDSLENYLDINNYLKDKKNLSLFDDTDYEDEPTKDIIHWNSFGDNINDLDSDDLKDFLKVFILNSLNNFLNRTANTNVIEEEITKDNFISSSISNGIRGILSEQIINFLKLKKPINNCKVCSKPVITPLGAGNKIFCSNKCRNSSHYTVRRELHVQKNKFFDQYLDKFDQLNIENGLNNLKLHIPNYKFKIIDTVLKYRVNKYGYENIFALTEISKNPVSLIEVEEFSNILKLNDEGGIASPLWEDKKPIFHNKKNIVCFFHISKDEIFTLLRNKNKIYKMLYYKELPNSEDIIKEYESDETSSKIGVDRLFKNLKFGA